MSDSEDAMERIRRRKVALANAREYVQELYAIKNDRGYPRFQGNAKGVLEEELTVARFLLESEDYT